MPSRIDEAGHTKAFDDPVAEHWGKTEMFSSAGGTRTDNTSVQSRLYTVRRLRGDMFLYYYYARARVIAQYYYVRT